MQASGASTKAVYSHARKHDLGEGAGGWGKVEVLGVKGQRRWRGQGGGSGEFAKGQRSAHPPRAKTCTIISLLVMQASGPRFQQD